MPGYNRCRQHLDNVLGPRGAGAPKGNQNARIHGLYSSIFPLEALQFAGEFGLDEEIAFTRLVVNRLATYLASESLTLEQTIQLTETLLRGTGRIAALLKTQRAISGDAADGLADAIATALDELSTIWSIDL